MLFGNITISDKMKRIDLEEGVKAGVLYYMEEGKVQSQTIIYSTEQEEVLMGEINQAGIEIINKDFVMRLKDKYGIKKQE